MKSKTRSVGASTTVRIVVALGYALLACTAVVANARAAAPAPAPVTPAGR